MFRVLVFVVLFCISIFSAIKFLIAFKKSEESHQGVLEKKHRNDSENSRLLKNNSKNTFENDSESALLDAIGAEYPEHGNHGFRKTRSPSVVESWRSGFVVKGRVLTTESNPWFEKVQKNKNLKVTEYCQHNSCFLGDFRVVRSSQNELSLEANGRIRASKIRKHCNGIGQKTQISVDFSDSDSPGVLAGCKKWLGSLSLSLLDSIEKLERMETLRMTRESGFVDANN